MERQRGSLQRRWGVALGLIAALIGLNGCGSTTTSGESDNTVYVTQSPAGQVHGAGTVPLSIAVSGNHFVNGSGDTIRLLGVDVPGTEYACEEGWGDSSLPITAASAASIAAWHANAVRVPLNEDCWLGINGQPAYGSATEYQQAIGAWVADLNADGLYVILDLHWTAPGPNVADGQRPMPDDHSAVFWNSVATEFKANPAVLFDTFNEPYSPQGNGNSSLAVSWTCWENGGCPLPVANQNGSIDDADQYSAVGMQALVTAIRQTGASQPILLGGLSYSNDLSGWLLHQPTDPDHQLVASLHAYYGNVCDDTSCWNSEVAPVAAEVPVVTGEFGQGYDCTAASGVPAADTTFDTTFMAWADSVGVSYLAWGWWVMAPPTSPCSSEQGGADAYTLISNADGTPVAPDGTALQAHLAALTANSSPPSTTATTSSPGADPPATPRSPAADIPWSTLSGCHLLPRRQGESVLAWLSRSGCAVSVAAPRKDS